MQAAVKDAAAQALSSAGDVKRLSQELETARLGFGELQTCISDLMIKV